MIYYNSIEILGDSAFIGEVVAVLDFARTRTAVGRLLIQDVGRRTTNLQGFVRWSPPMRMLRIVPRRPDEIDEAIADDPVNSAPLGASVGGGQFTGTGRGSPAQIKYRPAASPSGPAVHNRQCTLLHEMTHALRMMQGVFSKAPVYADPNYDDSEEFMAIQVENVFRSELRWPLRTDHHGYVAMSTPRTFDSRFDWLFRRFRDQMGLFATGVTNIDSDYNPFSTFA